MNPTTGDRSTATSARRWVAVLGLIAVVAVVAALIVRDEAGTTATVMTDVAPSGVVEESALPESVAPLYRGAVAHREVFSDIPCFCGCETMLGHRHLLDCFERSDGSGWEAHALGCAVCLGEAQQALDLLAVGSPTDEIVAAVIEAWSDPYQIQE